jgi:hypothetical protein
MTAVSGQLPGADLVERGVADLAASRESESALLVAMAATRLRAVGIDVPDRGIAQPGHRLYALLAAEHSTGAHAAYNALVGRMSSFARAAERAASRR